jgi:hypothetical protein
VADETALGQEAGEASYDHAVGLAVFIDWLNRSGGRAIPSGAIPPVDEDQLWRARSEAEKVAVETGRLDTLRSAHHQIIDWAMQIYRERGLDPVYFQGAMEPADQRRQAIETITDSATAYVLLDVLPVETATMLLSRLGVYHGAPAFKELESE